MNRKERRQQAKRFRSKNKKNKKGAFGTCFFSKGKYKLVPKMFNNHVLSTPFGGSRIVVLEHVAC